MSWLSGSYESDDEPATFIVDEELEGRPEPPALSPAIGGVIWIDSGSGPGYEMPWPEED